MRVVETQLCMSSRGKTVVGKVNERKILRTEVLWQSSVSVVDAALYESSGGKTPPQGEQDRIKRLQKLTVGQTHQSPLRKDE